jgi:hypothetical protein
MKQVIGYYNALEYRVEIDGKEVYQAGNSPDDSQAYTSKENGVGLRTMRSYCIYTTHEIAKENHAKYGGVERMEED